MIVAVPVMCGPGAPLDGDVLEVSFSFLGRLATILDNAAAKRGRPPSEVLADIVETVLRDNLVDALLDDGPFSGKPSAAAQNPGSR